MTTQDKMIIKTKWNSKKVPRCKFGKNHKWKGSKETGICLKCGYDVFDGYYKEADLQEKK